MTATSLRLQVGALYVSYILLTAIAYGKLDAVLIGFFALSCLMLEVTAPRLGIGT